MPATPLTTLIHYAPDAQTGGRAACGTFAPTDNELAGITARHGMVTCFACRRSPQFLTDQGVGNPTPLPEVIADTPELQRLMDDVLKACRNDRGMYVIEEAIHHGDYRSVRRCEFHDITALTVNTMLISSPYSYGDWLDPAAPHAVVRRPKVFELVADLRALRPHRGIGWSTFTTITDHS